MMVCKSRSPLFAALAVAALAGCGGALDAGYPGYIEGEYLHLAAPVAGYLDALQAARGSRVAAQAPVFTVAADPER